MLKLNGKIPDILFIIIDQETLKLEGYDLMSPEIFNIMHLIIHKKIERN